MLRVKQFTKRSSPVKYADTYIYEVRVAQRLPRIG